MIGMDKVVTAGEEWVRSMKEQKIRRLQRLKEFGPVPCAEQVTDNTEEFDNIEREGDTDEEGIPSTTVKSHPKQARMNIITLNLPAAFYRAKISDGNATFAITATARS